MLTTEKFISIGLLTFSTILLVIMYIRTKPGWSCSEKGCELTIGGSYKSRAECDSACGKKLAAAKQTEPILDRWECKNYQCVPSTTGYSDKGSCSAECPMPFLPTFQPAMSDWGQLWSNRWKAGKWGKYWTHRLGGGWMHK